MNEQHQITGGGCYCGAVRYQVVGPLRDVVNCHCSECQRLNGNFGSHSRAPRNNITLLEDAGLSWFHINDNTRRAFCKCCGSSLFWESMDQPSTGIVAGSLDDSSKLRTLGHIFVDEKAAYYEITDDLPQYSQSSDGGFAGDTV
jgi:hypothetical protein